MHLYCVRLSAIKPGTAERQTMIVNQVPAEHAEQARDAAIMRVCEADPRMYDADVRFIRANRTDDAFWATRATPAPALAVDACPRCGSHNISGGAFDVDAGTCSQKIFCSECEHEWADVYTLSGQVAL